MPNMAEACHDHLDRLKSLYNMRNSDYGLLTIGNRGQGGGNILEVKRRARKMHKTPPKPQELRKMLLRMGSELVITWMNYREACDNLNKIPKQFEKWEAMLEENNEI